MSRLRIRHRTLYSYTKPVRFGRHRLVLYPREGHDLRVVDMALDITPVHRLTWTRDVFGNSVALVDDFEPASSLEIATDVTIVRVPPFPTQTLHQPWHVPFPFEYDPMEKSIAAAYQIASYPAELVGVRRWLDEALPVQTRHDAEQMLLGLSKAIMGRIRYLRRTEKGVQTPAATLERGSGSCRDMATLMMEAARVLGISSRFVSGYLHCAASVAGRASTHAWMEAYLPGLGWRGYDPTLGESTTLKHVPVGVAHHPRGIMPISGTFDGARRDFLAMQVAVLTEEVAGLPT